MKTYSAKDIRLTFYDLHGNAVTVSGNYDYAEGSFVATTGGFVEKVGIDGQISRTKAGATSGRTQSSAPNQANIRASNLPMFQYYPLDWDDVGPITEDLPMPKKHIPEICPCGIKVSTNLCTYHPASGW